MECDSCFGEQLLDIAHDFSDSLFLLQNTGGLLVFDLRLDHGNGIVASVTEQVISALALPPLRLISADNDPVFSKIALFRDGVGVVVPAGRLELWNNEFPASI